MALIILLAVKSDGFLRAYEVCIAAAKKMPVPGTKAASARKNQKEAGKQGQ
jgi:hypothetical protein